MNIAILGFGVVGTGTYEAAQRAGVCVKRVLDVAVREGYEAVMTTDVEDILSDNGIGLVVETMGGLHPAYEFVSGAIKRKKHVVTANKQLVSHYYKELHELANENGVQFKYTASAGGGIPWLYNLRRARRCDEIDRVQGIINGTTNFILSKMQYEGAEFDAALREAQRLGYAEANPSADIDGFDLQRKCAISASIGFDGLVSEDDMLVSGIRHVTSGDVRAFKQMGYACRLVAHAERVGDAVAACVQPLLVREGSLLSGVRDNYNIVTLDGRVSGRLSFFGQGAGKHPTGTNVIHDVLDIAEAPDAGKVSLAPIAVDNSKLSYTYYLRTGAKVPGDVVEKDCGGYVITKPMSIEAMFRLHAKLREEDAAAFFAAIEE